MARTVSFDKDLSLKLQDVDFVRGYITESISGDEPQTLTDALLEVISLMGFKEYSELVGMQETAISRLVAKGEIPKIETFNKLLAPFNLKIRIGVEDVP